MEIEHQKEQERFAVRLPTGEAELTYVEREGKVLDLHHTYVPPEEREKGVGDALVAAAVRHARESGYRIIPTCPFVRAWMADHPEARDVVAA